MKTKSGKKRGGLQKKLFLLVLFSLLVVFGLGMALTLVHHHLMKTAVSDINDRQKDSIGELSGQIMEEVAYDSMEEQVNDISNLAGAYFSDCLTYVGLLRDRAAEVYTYHLMAPENVWAMEPKKSDEGKVITQRIYSDTVTDFKDEKLLEDTAILSAMRGIMENIYSRVNDEESKKYTTAIGSAFVVAPSGVLLIADDHSANKFDEDGKIKTIPLEERDWYRETMQTKKFYFSDLIYDTFSDKMEITVTCPVYVPGSDEIKAIVGVDLFFDKIEEYFETDDDSPMFMCMLNDNGEVVFSTENEGFFVPDMGEDLRNLTDNAEAKDIVNRAYEGPVGPEKFMYDEEEWILVTNIVDNMGWPVIAALPESAVQEPGENMIRQLDQINDDELDNFNAKQGGLLIWTILAIMLIIVVVLVGAVLVGSRIVRPLRSMTKRVHSLSAKDLYFTMSDDWRTNDEIEELAEAFAALSERTVRYIEENSRISAEKERIGTELSLATNIQASMLPSVFPAFPERSEFDIYATMDPAKEVGGDFYDFFFIDRDRLAIVIADVSGKGVPAALFMMMSKMLVNDYALLLDDSPAKILELVNEHICKNNQAKMFVTVWLGILDIQTGVITCANAGHEFPAVRKNGTYELFKDPHGFVIGGRRGMKYKEYEIKLEPGDALFVYTDGVAEATDAEDELYGTERMIEALNANADLLPEDLLPKMREAVDGFVREAPQFDDLTMLSLYYKGAE